MEEGARGGAGVRGRAGASPRGWGGVGMDRGDEGHDRGQASPLPWWDPPSHPECWLAARGGRWVTCAGGTGARRPEGPEGRECAWTRRAVLAMRPELGLDAWEVGVGGDAGAGWEHARGLARHRSAEAPPRPPGPAPAPASSPGCGSGPGSTVRGWTLRGGYEAALGAAGDMDPSRAIQHEISSLKGAGRAGPSWGARARHGVQ